MTPRPPQFGWNTSRVGAQAQPGGQLAARLLSIVDLGLMATICVAPFIFGGRHELGRLVFVATVGITSSAWCLRQSLVPKATWTRSSACAIAFATLALVLFQIAPLPVDWLARLSPRTHDLLPLWTGGDVNLQLGTWTTLSLTPHETTLALAMLVSYMLLIIVLSQRIQTTADVEKLLNTLAIAAVLMAAFGLAQFVFSNGQFFWCYVHPYRTTDRCAMGSFMNRNHFASFLAIGVAPLARWLLSVMIAQGLGSRRKLASIDSAALVLPGLLLASMVVVLLAIALSFSKGGILALATAAAAMSALCWHWRLVDAKYFYGVVGIGVVLVGLLSIYGYDRLTDRLNDFTSVSFDALDEGMARRKVWAANAAAIEHGWLIGSGAGSHREICQVYLSDPSSKEYTHAENGYLQVATETGVAGVVLLATAILLCGSWCMTCLRRLRDPAQQLCFAAAAAGVMASLVHSLVDFVWYIPACASVTLILAVVILRISQLSLPKEHRPSAVRVFSRPRWIECAVVSALLALWSSYVYVGPAVAAIHWDRYLRDAVASARYFENQNSPLAPELTTSAAAMRDPLSDAMLHHLEQAVAWDPSFARAHLRLAVRYVERFESSLRNSDNVMTLSQIRDAAQASSFASREELHQWLRRAFGADSELLVKAHAHARQAVALSPLQGDAYIYLAELGFLAGDTPTAAASYVAQAARAAPFNGDVAYQVGLLALSNGDLEGAITEWSRCFANTGAHQQQIVNLLAGRIPASVFIERLQPDWRTLREIWARYRQLGQPGDLQQLIAYTDQVTRRDTLRPGAIPPAYLWLWQSAIHTDMQQTDQALACLEAAYKRDQHVFRVRYLLGYSLKSAGRLSEAEPHLRWCLARSPENKGLRAAISELARLRAAQRDPDNYTADAPVAWQQ